MKAILLIAAITFFRLNVYTQQMKPGNQQSLIKNNTEKKINSAAQNRDALKQMEIQGMNAIGNWLPVGPFNINESGIRNGMGRVNCVAFIDADTWLVGTAGGGLWKTDVAGVYLPGIPPYDKPWISLTDKTAATGITGIAVNPSHTNKIYILTGDGDRKYDQYAGNYTYEGILIPSVGILKTTNSGTTWSETALNFESSDFVFPHKLLMDNSDANKMYAATTNGLYITGDGWNTTELRLAGEDVWDVEIHPTNGNIIYISTADAVYKSTDGLATEPTDISDKVGGNFIYGVPSRTNIAVCASAPDYLYLAAGNENWGLEGIYISQNKGATFSAVYGSTTGGINLLGADPEKFYKYEYGSPQYNLAFAVDPSNPNKLMIGGINMHVSVSQGVFWVKATDAESTGTDYVHKSIHTIEFNPFNGTIVCGTEGGLYASPGNNDSYWENRWRGLTIAQYNYFDVNNASPLFATEIIGGSMDNGTDANSGAAIVSGLSDFSPLSFDKVGGGSGYYCFSGTSDETQYRYTEDGTGHLFLHEQDNDGSWSVSDISPDVVFDYYDADEGPIGNYGIALAVNPNEFKSILAGYGAGKMYFSNDFGDGWLEIPLPAGTAINGLDEIAWNKNNGNNVAYRSNASNNIVVTNQFYLGIISGNYNWKIYDTDSLIGHTEISDLLFTDDAYPNNIIFATNSFAGSKKVYRLMPDSTWKNISYNLPNTRIRCVAKDETGIYAGSDIGVFFLADKDSVWSYFSKNLPTVPVTRIKVVEDVIGRRVYCSTAGRGIWKSDPPPPKRVTRYYVNKNAGGTNTGLNWTDAFTKVQDAIYKAIPGDSIWVAKGTYYPTSTSAIPGGSGARLYTFIIDSNTVIYGGFYGDETRLEQRDPLLYSTILSGNLGDTTIATDNAYHVLTIANSTKNSIIDGFTITGGRADGGYTSNQLLQKGSAFYASYDSLKGGRPLFTNCIFSNNYAAGGGAVYIAQKFRTSSSKTSFVKCTFKNNSTFDNGSGNRGGAIYFDASNPGVSPFGSMGLIIDSCLFEGNNAYNGGAIYNDAANNAYINYTISHSTFLHNKNSTAANGFGGAISNNTSPKGILKLVIDSCTFFDNDAPTAGGSIYNGGSAYLNDDDLKLYVKNSNFDSSSGYAIYSTGGKIYMSIDKSNFTNNSGGIQHVGATKDSLSFGKITRCSFINSVTGININCGNSGTGLTNKSANYTIDSCTFNNNNYGIYVSNYSQGGNAKHVQYTVANSTFANNILGAVYSYGSDNGNITATLKKNTFTNNKSANGGAIFSSTNSGGYAELTVDSCNFTGNKATTSGGAVYVYAVDKFTLTNSTFKNDTASNGGAVYLNAPYKNALFTGTFRNNSYTNNVATANAGALMISNAYFAALGIDMVNNTFTGNKAANYGGSMYVSSAASSDTLNVNIDSCTFNNNETTLNTTQSHGGALYLYSSGGTLTPVIQHTNFTNNHAAARGGAIYAEADAYDKLNLSLSSCNIKSNSSNLYGGALTFISLGTSDLSIDGCTIKNNSAVSAIGGIYIYQKSFQMNVSIANTIFDGNNTPGYSGALQISADGLITGSANKCQFKNNTANGGVAGAVRLYANDADLNDFDFTSCLFENNTASADGGAAYIQTDLRGTIASKFDNCVFTKNIAAKGGAFYLTASNYAANISVPLTNCTVVNNNATVETGGIYVTKTNASAIVHADMVNTILWNNTDAGVTPDKKQAYASAGATGFVKNTLIKYNIPAGFADSGNNKFSDPLFLNANDANGVDNIFANTDDGFSLNTGSPAIDAGTTVSLAKDITGIARPQGADYDMGAYEKNGCSVGDVTGVLLSSVASCSLQYSWDAVSGATNYEAAYKLNSSGTWVSLGNIGNVLTTTITGLTADNAYDFRVRAKNGNCKGNWAQLLNESTEMYDEPNNPTETNITSTSVKLKWQLPDCGDAPDNYTIKYKPASGGAWTTMNTNKLYLDLTGLTPNTQYSWKVRANYNGGNSAFTTQNKFKTLSSLAFASASQSTNLENKLSEQKATITLWQNIPNPFSNTTTIKCYLPINKGNVYLNVYNNTGLILRSVKLVNTGMNTLQFDAGHLSSGVYEYVLIIDGKPVAKKMMMITK